MDDLLRIEYIPLDLAMLWEDNQKKHDIPKLIESFERYGFKDAPKYEPTLNGGRGGIVAGNGRMEALAQMRRDGIPAPRGITEGEDGVWLVPVQFGVDSASELAAKAYGIDHNNLTLSGNNIFDIVKLWNEGFVEQLKALSESDSLPLSVSDEDIKWLLFDSAPHDDVEVEPNEVDGSKSGGAYCAKIMFEDRASLIEAMEAISGLLEEHPEWEAKVEL